MTNINKVTLKLTREIIKDTIYNRILIGDLTALTPSPLIKWLAKNLVSTIKTQETH